MLWAWGLTRLRQTAKREESRNLVKRNKLNTNISNLLHQLEAHNFAPCEIQLKLKITHINNFQHSYRLTSHLADNSIHFEEIICGVVSTDFPPLLTCVCIAIYNSLASQFVTKLHDILSCDAVVRECINKFLAIFTRTESHGSIWPEISRTQGNINLYLYEVSQRARERKIKKLTAVAIIMQYQWQ
jgi:hypothetical protein